MRRWYGGVIELSCRDERAAIQSTAINQDRFVVTR